MTREKLIKRWADIVESVFWAEERVAKEWNEKLQAMVGKPEEECAAFVPKYCRAVAEVIVNRMTDDHIKELYKDEKEGGIDE
jgi:hypothetical protein